MKWQRFFLAIAVSVLVSGCFWPFRSPEPSSSNDISASSVLVEILRPESLAKGGKLAFIPFTAGKDAEAGQQLDRLSLMIVKGASDAFEGSSSPIQMVTQGDPDKADMVLDGHIDEFRSVGGWRPVGLGKKPGVVAIKAEVRDRSTNEVLVIISGREEFKDMKKVEPLVYDIGRGIAQQLIDQESRP